MIKRRHPGAGKKRTGKTPKGRQVDPASLTEIQRLLAVRSRRRDYHLIQDRFGYLSAAYLAALAGEMQMALAEVYEVATFSARFDVVKEGEAPPPPVTPVLRTSTRLPGRRKLQGVLAASSLRKPVEGSVTYPCQSPRDLSSLGIRPGSKIKVSTKRGVIELSTRADSAVPQGMVFIPFCYAEASANVLTNQALDPFGKIPEFKCCAARVEALQSGSTA